MHNKTPRLLFYAFLLLIGFSSCQKETPALGNEMPIADAGPAQIVQLPTDSTVLNGTAKDPDGRITGYLWSQVNGPNTAVIANNGAASTAVKGLVAGAYIFQFMAIDSAGATATDTVLVTVKPLKVVTVTVGTGTDPYEVSFAGNAYSNFTDPNTPELAAAAWTRGGAEDILRGAFRFDLSSIPANVEITSAKLSLYSNPTPRNGNLVDANYGPNNAMYIQRIKSNWDKTSTWQTQPSVDTTGQVYVPQTDQSRLDLIDVDVTRMVANMYGNGNYGFMIRLENEVYFNSRIFCSSRYNDASKHPKLIITYRYK